MSSPALSLAGAFFIYFFYVKYVPLIAPFQALLLPVLLAVMLLTAFRVEWGMLLFIFFLPLINNLPYYFGIFEQTPHAPTALLLFLFFLEGWLLHSARKKPRLSFEAPIYLPLLLLSVLILISALITIFRYANFAPFRSHQIYELTTNVNGVSAGGAIMSSIFFSLDYITGFVLFFIFLNQAKTKEFVYKALTVLLSSSFLSISFGFYQQLHNINLGNTPKRVIHSTINATFKDPLSCGVYLAVIGIVATGFIPSAKGGIRLLSIITVLGAIILLPFTGAMGGLLGLLLAAIFAGVLVLKAGIELRSEKPQFLKKIVLISLILLLSGAILSSVFLIFNNSSGVIKIKNRIAAFQSEGGWAKISSQRTSYFWPIAAQMLKDYPLSGVGMGAYIIELPNYAELHQYKLRTADSAENYFLQVSAELGILGLLLTLWIAGLILRQLRSTYRQNKKPLKKMALVICLMAGIVVFLINFLFHTYIGSYEITYLFWLLIALLFVLGGTLDKPAIAPARLRKKVAIGSIPIILISSAALLWNSSHSLSLAARTRLLHLHHNFGFYPVETTESGEEFQWSREHGGFSLKVEKPTVAIPILASHPVIDRYPITVNVYLVKDLFAEKRLLAEFAIDQSDWRTYEISLVEEVGQDVILLFEVSRTWNPKKTLGTPDTRDLGIAVGKIHFK